MSNSPTAESFTLSGLLPVNKPSGMSTYDVIRRFKSLNTDFKGKIGHGGTLDVFAEGLVILMLGQATKQFDHLQQRDKIYRAGVRLGYQSDSLDIEGSLVAPDYYEEDRPAFAKLVAAIESAKGEQEQLIPEYSAAKVQGTPRYKLARQQIAQERKSKLVQIYDLNLVAYRYPLATIDVRCSSGTYVRQLTFDIFSKLGIPSFLYSLRRLAIGSITLDLAVEIDDLRAGEWEDHLLQTA